MKYPPPRADDADFVVYLDYGADCFFGYYGQLTLSEHGLQFTSAWQFALGTQLALRLCVEVRRPGDRPTCAEVTGLVVGCDPTFEDPSRHETTLLFIDVPASSQRQIDRLATRPELMGNLN